MYPEEMVRPMREELTRVGFREMRTAEEVDAVLGAGHAVPDELPVALAESGPAGPDDEPASPPGP